MADELVPQTEGMALYHRLNGESAAHYELFAEFCKVPPSSRSLANFCRRTGVPPATAKKLSKEWSWEVRAELYDTDALKLRPDPRSMDEEASIAGQLAASKMLLELGLSAAQVKNPALISTDQMIKLIEKGVEIERKAMGQADLNVQFSVEDMSRVNNLLGDLLEGEAIEIEVPELEEDHGEAQDPTE